VNSITSSRPFALSRSLRMGLAAVVMGALMATGLAITPAHAVDDAVHLDVTLTTQAGKAPSATLDVYAEPVINGALTDTNDYVVATRSQGVFELELTAEQNYILEFHDRANDSILGSAPLYYGGTSKVSDATVITYIAGNHSLDANIVSTAKVTGKVVDAAKKALKTVEVNLFGFDGVAWTTVATDFTSAKGVYTFANVEPGTYKLAFQRLTDDADWLENESFPNFGSKYIRAYSGNAETLEDASLVSVGQTGTVTQNATLKLGGSITGTLATSHEGSTVAGLNTLAYKLLGNPVTGFTGIDKTRGTILDSVIFSSFPFGPGYIGKTVAANGKYSLAGLPEGYYVVQVVDSEFDFEELGHPEQYVGGGTNWRTGTKFVVKAGKVTKAPAMTLKWATALPRTDAFLTVENTEGSALGGVEVEITQVDGTLGMTAVTNDDGIAEFSRLVPGNYTLAIADSGYLPLETSITVAALGLMQRITLDDRVDFYAPTGASIDGSPLVGQTLTVESPTTLDALVNVDRAFQWYRDGVPIFGARDATYKVRGVDLDATITARVELDALSYASLLETAALDEPITTGDAPEATAAPVVSFTGKLGTGTMLRANAGRWDVAAVTPAYTWLVDGSPIGQSGATYKVTAADAGKSVTASVVASKFGYASSAPVSSNVIAVPKFAAKVTTPAKVTSTTAGELTTYTVVSPVMSQSGYTFEQQWRVNGQLEGTASTFSALAAFGGSLTVTVTGTHPQYADVSQQIVVVQGPAPTTFDEPFIEIGPDFETVLVAEQYVQIGEELRATNSAWYYADLNESPATYRYQWLRNDVAIKGATQSSYTPTLADADAKLDVTITVTNPRYAPATRTFRAGFVDLDDALSENPATVTITGEAVAGKTLTAKVGPWSVKGAVNSLQWYTCPAGDPVCETTEPAPVAGATAASFTIPASTPVGTGFALIVRSTKTGYYDGVAFSAPVQTTTPPLGTVTVTVAPKLAKSGDTYSITSGSYSVAGGETSVEWFADTTSVGTDATFTLSPSETGKAVVAVVSYEREGYTPVATSLAVQQGPAPTVGTPAIGNRVFGGSLTIANPFTYSSGDKNLATLSYQWFVNGKAIKGATKSALPATEALLNTQISVRVVSKSALHPTATFTSAATTIVLKNAPQTADPVTFSVAGGTLKPGAKATIAPITWDVAGLKVVYNWQSRVDGSAWTTIPKATKTSYTATAADAGKQLRVRVSATKAGYWFAEIGSATQTVNFDTPLEFSTDPLISGTGAVGTTLSVSKGTVNTAGTTTSYQWLLDGVVIPGATKANQVIAPSHFGKELSVRVTAARAGSLPVTVEPRSVEVSVGAAPVVTSKNAPKITGALTSGSTLTASTGLWNIDGLTFTFQWKRNGVDVAGATSRSYELTSADVATRVSVTVTATRTGYAPGAATSAATAVIK